MGLTVITTIVLGDLAEQWYYFQPSLVSKYSQLSRQDILKDNPTTKWGEIVMLTVLYSPPY